MLCLLLLLYGLGRLPFLGPDEPRYAEVAREMFASGDWVTPRLGGIAWFEKPALLYWLAALGYQAFGVSEFSARIGVALTASAGVFLLFLFGRSERSGPFGYLAAGVLVSMGLWIGFARGATFDMPLSVALEMALLSFWWWEERAPDRHRFWLLSCFALGLAVLAKGLVGIVLPGAIIGSYLLITRRFTALLRRPLLLTLGGAIFAVTAATWYWPMFARHGRLFFDEFFVAHHFRRYLSDVYRHPQPFYFFIVVAVAGCFPWSVFLLGGMVRDAQRLRTMLTDEKHRLRLFLWLWVVIPVVFFSFSGSKLPGYILPIFPAAALLIGLELDEAKDPRRWASAITALLLAVASVSVGVLGPQQLGAGRAASWVIASLGVVAAIAFAGICFLRGDRRGATFLPFALAAIVVATTYLLFPGLARRESIRDLADVAEKAARPGERLIFYLDSNQGVNFYSTALPLRDARSELVTVRHGDEIEPFVRERDLESVLVMCYERWREGLVINEHLRTELISTHPRRIACSPGCDWVLLRVSPVGGPVKEPPGR